MTHANFGRAKDSVPQASTISQMSDTKGSVYYVDQLSRERSINKRDQNLNDSQPQLNQSLYDAGLTHRQYIDITNQARKSELRHLRQQHEVIAQEYKQRFFDNLQEQMDKRIT